MYNKCFTKLLMVLLMWVVLYIFISNIQSPQRRDLQYYDNYTNVKRKSANTSFDHRNRENAYHRNKNDFSKIGVKRNVLFSDETPFCEHFSKLRLIRHSDILPKRLVKNIQPRVTSHTCGSNRLLAPTFDKDRRIWMLFIVKSAPQHFKFRDTIRQTWARVSHISSKSFVTIFVVGKTNNRRQESLLHEENHIYGDMLQCDVVDSYRNLTNKVLATFHWVLKSRLSVEHYAFCDDDTVMNIANIYVYFNEMEHRKKQGSLVCGHTFGIEARVRRNHSDKWYMTHELYNTTYYPTFCHGAMWTVSLKMINDLYCVSKVTNQTGFFIDDVYITGVLRHKLENSETLIHPAVLDPPFGNLVQLLHCSPSEKSAELERRYNQNWKKFNELLTKRRYTPIVDGSKIQFLPYDVKYRFSNDTLGETLKQEWENLKTIL